MPHRPSRVAGPIVRLVPNTGVAKYLIKLVVDLLTGGFIDQAQFLHGDSLFSGKASSGFSLSMDTMLSACWFPGASDSHLALHRTPRGPSPPPPPGV